MESVFDSLCLLCLWIELPFWMKLLIGVGLIVAAFLGGWMAAAGAGFGVAVGAMAGGIGAYEAMDKYADFDAYAHDSVYGNGVDAVEDVINLVSPVPAPVADATGLKMPGSGASDGMVDDAIGAEHEYNRRMDERVREIFDEE